MLSGLPLAVSFRSRVHPVAGKRLGVIPNGFLHGDTLPHIPVDRITEAGIEATQPFVNIAADNDGRTLNAKPDEHMLLPITENPRLRHRDQTWCPSLTLFASIVGCAKCGCDGGFPLNPLKQCVVESRQDPIVLMQDMDPAATRPRHTSVP